MSRYDVLRKDITDQIGYKHTLYTSPLYAGLSHQLLPLE